MEWYLAVLRKYADFSGRARRKEYWMYALFTTIIACALMFVDNVLHLYIVTGRDPFSGQESRMYILYSLYGLATFIPGLAVWVRRLHDTGRSGWWALFIFVPIVGPIMLLIWAVQDSQFGDNEYGPSPKGELAY